MATVAATMKNCLLNYPSIFPCPLAVSLHWFGTGGSGYYWDRNGELVNGYVEENNSAMDYSDLDEREVQEQKDIARYPDTLADLHQQRAIQLKSERLARNFIADNIDSIACADVTLSLFNYNARASYWYVEYPSLNSPALNFPENICKDWAIALDRFLSEWLVALNYKYGVGTSRDMNESIAHWPEHIKQFRTKVLEAQDRLIPILHGISAETYKQQRNELADSIMSELLK
jgi:hypothetical protein